MGSKAAGPSASVDCGCADDLVGLTGKSFRLLERVDGPANGDNGTAVEVDGPASCDGGDDVGGDGIGGRLASKGSAGWQGAIASSSRRIMRSQLFRDIKGSEFGTCRSGILISVFANMLLKKYIE